MDILQYADHGFLASVLYGEADELLCNYRGGGPEAEDTDALADACRRFIVSHDEYSAKCAAASRLWKEKQAMIKQKGEEYEQRRAQAKKEMPPAERKALINKSLEIPHLEGMTQDVYDVQQRFLNRKELMGD